MLWSAISAIGLVPCLFFLTTTFAQAQPLDEEQEACQLIQRPWNPDTEAELSPEAVLANELEAMCRLNNQRPRTDEGAIATNSSPSPRDFTEPSLWWQQEQASAAVNSDRLIDSWRAYDAPPATTTTTNQPASSSPHVDIEVNSQIWRLLNYLERYTLITQFGESAKAYRYQLRLFANNRLVGLYVCDFSHPSPATNRIDATIEPLEPELTYPCTVELNYFGQGAIRGRGN